MSEIGNNVFGGGGVVPKNLLVYRDRVVCLDSCKEVEVVVAKELKGVDVDSIVRELRKDFLKLKNS